MLEYQVLREIESRPVHTQRSLAQHLGVSLGKANYILGALIQKGLVRAKRLKNNPGRVRWHYLLTPKGLEEKLTLARKYLDYKLNEFDKVQREIEVLKSDIQKCTK